HSRWELRFLPHSVEQELVLQSPHTGSRRRQRTNHLDLGLAGLLAGDVVTPLIDLQLIQNAGILSSLLQSGDPLALRAGDRQPQPRRTTNSAGIGVLPAVGGKGGCKRTCRTDQSKASSARSRGVCLPLPSLPPGVANSRERATSRKRKHSARWWASSGVKEG